MHSWVLLVYKLSSEPSARRVFIWRKLKRLGALSLQDAVWVLPATPWTVEQFQWLAVEVRDMGGTSMVWEAQQRLDGQDDDLIRQFNAQVDATYSAIMADLARPDVDQSELILLSRQFQQAQAQDYFHSTLGQRVRAALEHAADRDSGSDETGGETVRQTNERTNEETP
jgi:hypothetical protein